MELPHGRSRYRHHGCRCEVCVEANRLYMRELRARKRTLTPLPAAPVATQDEPGPVIGAARRRVVGRGGRGRPFVPYAGSGGGLSSFATRSLRSACRLAASAAFCSLAS